MAGARLGTYKTMLTKWDHREVQWFDSLEQIWDSIKNYSPRDIMAGQKEELAKQLDLPMNALDPDQSQFFKHHYRSNWHNQGVMIREIDVIRRQEGW
jgi:hypothetical protein